MSNNENHRRFRGQSVIVTGGSRGIGRSVALAFAAEGADLVVNYAGNHDAANETARQIHELGSRCVLVQGSVAEPEVAERLVDSCLEHFGRIDVLVNNAGVSHDGYMMMLSDRLWQSTLGVNLHGTFYCCRAAIEKMREQGWGNVINMSSTAGLKGRPGQVAYAATKGAVISLTKTLADELGPRGIRVNTVAPGFIETDMVSDLLDRMRDAILDRTPVQRIGTGEDVAAAVLYLASPESSYVTGHVLQVNGGLSM